MLHIIISPAKKMNVCDDMPVEARTPLFLEQSGQVMSYLQGLDYDTLKTLWNCSDRLAAQNAERLRGMDLAGRTSPAVFAYEGIQYQSMAPVVFEQAQLDYIGRHLYILSGFYGLLRAFDGVVPYRLEMQAKLHWQRDGELVTSLYDFWGDRLYRALVAPAEGTQAVAGTDAEGGGAGQTVIVNLASREYSRAVEPWVEPQVRWVDCVFGELTDSGRVQVKATAAKIARGAMVRFMAEHLIADPEQLTTFDLLGYRYRPERSDGRTLVFARSPRKEGDGWR